jgi:hypothetical protein
MNGSSNGKPWSQARSGARQREPAADRISGHVVTEDGKVLRDLAEPLSEHFGRGSDKPELKAARLVELGLKAKK